MNKTEFAKVVAQNVKKYRLQNGLTQEEFSELAGISLSFCAAVETARKVPSAYTMWTMAERMNVTVDYFVYPDSCDLSIKTISRQLLGKNSHYLEFVEQIISICNKYISEHDDKNK